ACGGYDLVLEPMESSSRFAYNLFVVPPDSEPEEELVEPEITQGPPWKPIKTECPDIDTTNWPDPFVLTHADIKKKEAYIRNTKKTLQLFRLVADDTIRREEILSVQELACEANKYVKVYVKPIMDDPEANKNLETKLETAKLHLLSALLHHDMGMDYQAELYLDLIRERYGNDPSLLDVTMDPTDTGFITLREAIEHLEERVSIQAENN
ncbi:MAG: hypothetical protein JRE24_07990, partial [Deltaproteobacteria bacterium]|nr:hypothetical protein [Deltaproteobacteria bacterium]